MERHIMGKKDEPTYSIGSKTKQNAFYQHLSSCEHYNYLVNLFRFQNDTLYLKKFNIPQIRDNTTVIDRAGH